MAARSIKRVSKRFYKALNDVSTTDFFNYSTSHKDRPFLSSRKGSESAQGKRKGKYFLHRFVDARCCLVKYFSQNLRYICKYIPF